MTIKGGSTGQACAACKYQRRRCASDCPLAPFFPADQPKMFQNAHKLFGVSNILKILKQLDPSQKVIAMKSIKYQANMRDKYPVYGCLLEIQQLSYQIQMAEEELQATLGQLAYYRQRHQQQQQENISSTTESLSQLQLGMAPPGPGNALTLIHQDHPPQYIDAVTPLPITYSDHGYNTEYFEAKENNVVDSLWIQQPYANANNNSMAMSNSQPLSLQQETAQDYDEIYPFFDTIDDSQSYMDSKEVYESSSESSLKDTRQSVEQMAENELKSAAACFSLTSVN